MNTYRLHKNWELCYTCEAESLTEAYEIFLAGNIGINAKDKALILKAIIEVVK